MTFPEAVKSAFKNYAKFDGRASRSEYWWFVLFQILLLLIPIFLIATGDNSIAGIGALLYLVIGLGTLLPGLGLLFRRLHDTDRSAWWILICFIPFGSIVLLVFTCLESTKGPNKYGMPPGSTHVADTFS